MHAVYLSFFGFIHANRRTGDEKYFVAGCSGDNAQNRAIGFCSLYMDR